MWDTPGPGSLTSVVSHPHKLLVKWLSRMGFLDDIWWAIPALGYTDGVAQVLLQRPETVTVWVGGGLAGTQP